MWATDTKEYLVHLSKTKGCMTMYCFLPTWVEDRLDVKLPKAIQLWHFTETLTKGQKCKKIKNTKCGRDVMYGNT